MQSPELGRPAPVPRVATRPAPNPAAPRLSVVYAPAEPPDSLRRVAFTLHGACGPDAELVVVHGGPVVGVGSLPGVRFVSAPDDADRRRRRELGARATAGDVVIFVDDADDVALRSRLGAVREATGHEPVTSGAAPLDAVARPRLSVVVPVRDGASTLGPALAALAASDLPRNEWELIVVCDGCTDESAEIAARYADLVVRLSAKRAFGPAYARNRGVELARAAQVAFVDADVRVRPDTLRRFVEALHEEPTASAVVGIYDDEPPAPGFVSQYRNLLNHWVQREQDPADAVFWSGCGAVRRAAFEAAGGYDEWRFPRPQVEDVDLARRFREHGYRIVLRPDIQATHLKTWTLGSAFAADLHGVGAPWARVGDGSAVLRMGVPHRSARTRLAALLAWLALAALLLALVGDTALWGSVALAALLALTVAVWPALAFLARVRGPRFAAAAFPLEVAHAAVSGAAGALGWLARVLLGDPRPDPAVEAFAEVGVRTWPPVPVKRR